MKSDGHNLPHPHTDQVIDALLRATESNEPIDQLGEVAGGTGGVRRETVAAMRRDRAALRAALAADLGKALPAHRVRQFTQVVRDELDRELLADLSKGVPVSDRLPISKFAPVRAGRLSSSGSWRVSRVMAMAATLALVGGVAWLAMQRPSTPGKTLGSSASAGPRELPEWAVLPPARPDAVLPPIASGLERTSTVQGTDAALEPMFTRDAATALAWAKRGVLAVRITTDSPRRDRERLDNLARASTRTDRWSLSTSAPPGIEAIPARPWPIETGMAGASEGGFVPSVRPESATLAAFGLMLRPTTEAIESARDALEESLAGAVIFERVDTLAAFAERPQPEPAPDSAMDILWWTKPASQWSPRVRVPVLVEFGTPEPGAAAPRSAPAK